MDFYAILDQIVDLLRSRERVTYRLLKRQFNLDDAALNDLKDELFFTHPQIADEDGRGFVWTRASRPEPAAPSAAASGTQQEPAPLAYIPQHLIENILTARAALAGERKPVTVLFCDLVNSTVLAQRLGPEVMHAVLNRFFALVTSNSAVQVRQRLL